MAIILVVSAMAGGGSAHGATYELMFTGQHLTAKPGVPPVPGVKKLVFGFSVPAIPAGQCAQSMTVLPTSFTDGRNTLASLAAAGYLESPGDFTLNICISKNGKGISSWFADLTFYKKVPPYEVDTYEAQVGYMPGEKAYELVATDVDTQVQNILHESIAGGGKWTLVVQP
jgi:hypothetical protein